MSQIPIQGFHIEPTNICTLKCPGCARTKLIKQWPKHWQNHNLEIDAVMDFLDIDLTGKSIDLCGNYGDPIYHPHLFDLISAFKSRGCTIKITTNGSYRSSQWWNDLCDQLDSNDSIIFSVDGLPDNFTQYRVNADWDSINLGMTTCVSRDINVIWKFIVFRYNQDHINEARLLADHIGVKEFVISLSDRFDEDTAMYLPNTESQGIRKPMQDAWKQNQISKVDPKCYAGKEYFISADGFFSPCCFVADHRFLYKTQFGKAKHQYDIRNTTLTEVLSRPATVEFYQKLPVDPPGVCSFNCPKTT